MKKTNPSFNSFSPFSLSNPFFAQTITIAIIIAIHCNNRQQCMQPALSPPFPPPPSIIIVIMMIKITATATSSHIALTSLLFWKKIK